MITESLFARETFLWWQCLLGEQRWSSCGPFLGGKGLFPDCCHSEHNSSLDSLWRKPLSPTPASESAEKWGGRGCFTFFHALNSLYFWKGKSTLFTSLSMYGQILFLTDFLSERITKPPRDTSLETLPWSLCPVWVSVIGCCSLQVRLLQWPSHHGWASMAGKVELGRPPTAISSLAGCFMILLPLGESLGLAGTLFPLYVTWGCWVNSKPFQAVMSYLTDMTPVMKKLTNSRAADILLTY